MTQWPSSTASGTSDSSSHADLTVKSNKKGKARGGDVIYEFQVRKSLKEEQYWNYIKCTICLQVSDFVKDVPIIKNISRKHHWPMLKNKTVSCIEILLGVYSLIIYFSFSSFRILASNIFLFLPLFQVVMYLVTDLF